MTDQASLSRLAAFLLCAVAMLACAGTAKPVHYEDRLKARASFDFSCPEGQLTVTKLGDRNTAGVEGCGKRATYYNDANDQWVLNTASGVPEAAPAAGSAVAPVAPPASEPGPTAGSAPATP